MSHFISFSHLLGVPRPGFRGCLAAAVGAALLIALSSLGRAEERTMAFDRFGTVHLYYEPPRPSRVVLFVSGDGGWNLGVIDISQVAPVESLKDLPLIEVPAESTGGDLLAVHLTGDGGWGVTDKGLSRELAWEGIPVVALNSLKYFWTPRTPESASRDLARILDRYTEAWGKNRVILIGYSLGADVLPFMYNRLPAELRNRVTSVVLLGPSPTVEFEFHVTDWLGRSPGKRALPVLPEVEKITKALIICFYGEEDKDNICRAIDPQLVHLKVVSLPTGHRFGRDFEPIARAILGEIEKR
jgi:type IV secretory pathway VirJ component